jgi:hypothetical protein
MALCATLDADLPRQDLGTYQEDGGDCGHCGKLVAKAQAPEQECRA